MPPRRKSKKSVSTQVGEPPAVGVVSALLAKYGTRIARTAVCLQTPTPELVPLQQVSLSPACRDFILRYEPRIERDGLYAHQVRVFEALGRRPLPNVVLTTTTGSGKSLVFWTWLVEAMRRDRNATAVACFPTQALLWNQAERLQKLSTPGSLVIRDGQAYAGTLEFDGTQVPWTVWHGTTNSPEMELHTRSTEFWKARIRITTVDKVHWSLLLQKHAPFLQHLRAIVVDEAHVWHGLGGANVRTMFDRMRLSLDLERVEHPAFFLASATLNHSAEFAADLTGLRNDRFLVVDDTDGVRIDQLPATEVPASMASDAQVNRPPCRYVLMLLPANAPVPAQALLADVGLIGEAANALCFVQSKFAGHRLCKELAALAPGRNHIAYDADLPAPKRREVEKQLLVDGGNATTVVATNALELGIDLPELDVVVMDDLPPRRADLLQRIGRAGRRSGRPGLAILCLGYSPLDAHLAEHPQERLSVAAARTLPLPLHLESLRVRMMNAAFSEWRSRLRQRAVSWDAFNEALRCHFGEAPTVEQLRNRTEAAFGDLVEAGDTMWFYKSFRVSASQGKRDLVLRGTERQVIASVEDFAVFRDAHPGGVYLAHNGQRFRVVAYRGRFKLGTWTHPQSDVVLGKFMHALDRIEVVPEQRHIATRGRWKDRFELYLELACPKGSVLPKQAPLEYGIWQFVRKFDGYTELELAGRHAARSVSMAEVTAAFKKAMAEGEDFPFLHNFTYRTCGWRWRAARVVGAEERRRVAPAVEGILHTFMCGAVECSRNDLSVTLDSASGDLRVIDGTPGGNGLSEALLRDGRAAQALLEAVSAARSFAQQSADVFERYVAEECHVESKLTAAEVANAIEILARAWSG